jgi:hypothetical protein
VILIFRSDRWFAANRRFSSRLRRTSSSPVSLPHCCPSSFSVFSYMHSPSLSHLPLPPDPWCALSLFPHPPMSPSLSPHPPPPAAPPAVPTRSGAATGRPGSAPPCPSAHANASDGPFSLPMRWPLLPPLSLALVRGIRWREVGAGQFAKRPDDILAFRVECMFALA